MRVSSFMILFFIFIFFIPDAWIADFVKNHIPISGDGEEAMDSFEMYVIVIKTALCGFGAYVVMTLLQGRRKPPKK